MESLFKLKEYGTNVQTEITAGFTTFFAMAYIVFVNPNILSLAGMNKNGVFIATCLSAAIGTLMMALFANLPYAQAPGMGINAFFTFTLCMAMGFVWQEALAMVFICGLIAMVLTVSNVRRAIITAIPDYLKNAIGGAIGLFIAYIGIKNAGIIEFGSTIEGVTAGADAVPRLVAFNNAGVLLSLFGIFVTAALMIRKVRGALLIGIVVTTIAGIPFGVTDVSGFKLFDLNSVGDIREVAFAFFGSPGLGSLFADPSRLFIALIAVFSLVMSDIFDTIGTFIGTGRYGGILTKEDEEQLKTSRGLKTRFERGLFADMVATTCGSLLGTSNVTTYVESAAGMGVGGRTGLTSLTTGILLLLCIPFVSLVGVVPAQATAPALIIVGVLMCEAFTQIEWGEFEKALPAFFTVIVMAFGYSISYGMAAGFIFDCLIKICKGKAREIHPVLGGASVLFIIQFVMLALR